jgi:hypothetical protein
MSVIGFISLIYSINQNDAVGMKRSVCTNLLEEENDPMNASFAPRSSRLSLRSNPLHAGAAALIAAFVVAVSLPAGAAATPTLTLPVSVSGLDPGEVETVLASTPLDDLSAAQLAKPISQLSGLGILPGGSLRQALTKTIEELAAKGDTLGALGDSSGVVSELSAQLSKVIPAGLLSLLLEGKSLSSVLTSGLGSLSPSQLVEGLLTSASEPEREQLIEHILTGVSPELQSLVGSTLAGEPFETSTVNELASRIGTTTGGFDEDLGSTIEQIPPTAMAVTTALTDGKALTALEGANGLHLGVLGSGPEGAGGSGGTPGSSGGGAGGAGGSGASGAGGESGAPGATIILNTATVPGAATPGVTATTASAKVRVLSHKVKGHTVILVLQVPAAGTLRVSGRSLRSQRSQVAEAERVTLRVALSKAGAASLRKRRHELTIKLETSFAPVSGASSSAVTTVKVG